MYAKLLQGTSSKVTIESLIGIEERTTITSLLKNKKINNENCDLFQVIMPNTGRNESQLTCKYNIITVDRCDDISAIVV